MGNIFKKFGLFRKATATVEKKLSKQEDTDKTGEMETGKHQENTYENDQMKMQLLYEKWVVMDTWQLRKEAVFLISARDPEDIHESEPLMDESLNGIWNHAKTCVEQGLLNVINREDEPDQWLVRPVEIYYWAKISRIPMPEAMVSLMEFITSTVLKQSVSINQNNGNQTVQDRERVLGLALAILAACPEKCRDSDGSINIDMIIQIIDQKSVHWLGDNKIDMSTDAIRELIHKWIGNINLPVNQ